MPPLYSTKVIANGGRHGSVRSEDGLLDLSLALPKALGGSGGATNPEQLFAAGYAACFENSLLRVSREARHHFSDDQVEVVAEIGLSRNEQGDFVLSANYTSLALAGATSNGARQMKRRPQRPIRPCDGLPSKLQEK